MTRAEATQKILAAEGKKGLTFDAIATAVGRHKVWVTAALLGQATMSTEETEKAGAVFGPRTPELSDSSTFASDSLLHPRSARK